MIWTRSIPVWLATTVAIVRLHRPLNLLMMMTGVAVGSLLAGGPEALFGATGLSVLLAALSAALIGGAGNNLNDALDLETDRINRPRRPLPSGQISPRWAKRLWRIGTVIGLALGAYLSPLHAGLAVAAAGLLGAYNVWLKHRVLVGNITVALLVALTLIYGGWVVGPAEPVLLGALFAFLATLAREMIKDVEDRAGDAAIAARTLPLVYGVPATIKSLYLILLSLVALTPLPFLWLGYSGLYLLLVLLADLLLLRVLWLVQTPVLHVHIREASFALKAAIGLGMAALATAGVAG